MCSCSQSPSRLSSPLLPTHFIQPTDLNVSISSKRLRCLEHGDAEHPVAPMDGDKNQEHRIFSWFIPLLCSSLHSHTQLAFPPFYSHNTAYVCFHTWTHTEEGKRRGHRDLERHEWRNFCLLVLATFLLSDVNSQRHSWACNSTDTHSYILFRESPSLDLSELLSGRQCTLVHFLSHPYNWAAVLHDHLKLWRN